MGGKYSKILNFLFCFCCQLNSNMTISEDFYLGGRKPYFSRNNKPHKRFFMTLYKEIISLESFLYYYMFVYPASFKNRGKIVGLVGIGGRKSS